MLLVGGDYNKAWFTLQEYFERLGTNPEKWGKPFAALLGTYYIQKELGIAAIGGKDSMSGTYNDIDVPPTLVTFCVGVVDTNKVVSNEFKKSGSKVVLLRTKLTEDFLPDLEDLKENYEIIHKAISEGKVLSCNSIRQHGVLDVVFKAAVGNKLGFKFTNDVSLFNPMFGSFVIELKEDVGCICNSTNGVKKCTELGVTTEEPKMILPSGEALDLEELIKVWEKPLEKIFPVVSKTAKEGEVANIVSDKTCSATPVQKVDKPVVFIPVFPGTNTEYDVAKAVHDAGGIPNVVVFKNLTGQDIEESVLAYEKAIREAHIIIFPGGSSSGDEPDGPAKFIGTVFRKPQIKAAVHAHLNEKNGLILGICNGFQALIRLGLIPYGEIRDMDESMPTIAMNAIGSSQSRFVRTKVTSKLSPWLSKVNLGDEFLVPVANANGRFVASEEVLKELIANGQIATQYVDEKGNATYDIQNNAGNSIYAIESVTSKDGRILGTMTHPERTYRGNVKNVLGNVDTKLFESGIEYFK